MAGATTSGSAKVRAPRRPDRPRIRRRASAPRPFSAARKPRPRRPAVREVQRSRSRISPARSTPRGAALESARGVDPRRARARIAPARHPEETLGRRRNDSRALAAHTARLACSSAGLRARREGARGLTLAVEYADGQDDGARRTFAEPLGGSAAIAVEALRLLERAVKRRVRVRRLRLSAWGATSGGEQLTLWPTGPLHPTPLESVIDRARDRSAPRRWSRPPGCSMASRFAHLHVIATTP